MNKQAMEEHAWTLVRCASSVSKPLLWLRDTDSPQRLTPELRAPLSQALRTVVLLPRALPALRTKLNSIYQRALDEPLVGIGASPYATREGDRTAKYGLLAAIDYAKRKQKPFVQLAKKACARNPVAWKALFDLADKFIDCLDWGEFVLENSRGQAACLVLECLELADAVHHKDQKEIRKELGDVFYNLMAFSLSVRIRAKHLALTSSSSGRGRPRR